MKKVIFLAVLLFLAIPCSARTIVVDANGTGDYPTIQAAIDDANNSDAIVLQPGIYTGNGNRDIDFLGKAITVRSTNPNDPGIAATTTIDCQGTSSNPHRGFYFHHNICNDSIVAGLTITNGYSDTGGGIYCIGVAAPSIINCSIIGNTGTTGGGIYVDSGPTIIKNCIIKNNSISSDTAYGCGGGIYSDMGDILIEDCIIKNNSSNYAGGGIYCGGGGWGHPLIRDCLIANNTDGGVYLIAEQPTIENCTIVNNSSVYCGGINCHPNIDENTIIQNCILWDNKGREISGNPQISIMLPKNQTRV